MAESERSDKESGQIDKVNRVRNQDYGREKAGKSWSFVQMVRDATLFTRGAPGRL
jgi:hypothetical protein